MLMTRLFLDQNLKQLKILSSLGIADDEQLHLFELRDKVEVDNILGIRIEKEGSKKFTLTQTGLVTKVLKEANMDDWPPFPLGKDEEGAPFDEGWEYAVVVDMLMYLSTNSRPDITYAVNECA